MSTSGFTPDWLALRETADAQARAQELLDPLRARLAGADRLVIRDLGSGTGSMGRWLAARLNVEQHWILHDRDPELLLRAELNRGAADYVLSVQTCEGDLTGLRADDLADTSLVTASALLDLLTFEGVDELAAACVRAGCPALLTLSVAGKVDMTPAEPLDAEFTAAFNDHQRRSVGGRRLLGPDACRATTEAFEHRGAVVLSRPSPWRLGAADASLTQQWLRGWVAAACEQRSELAAEADAYLRRRLDASRAGKLRAVIQHVDLLALP